MTEPDRCEFRKSGSNFARQVTNNTMPIKLSSLSKPKRSGASDLNQGNFINNSEVMMYGNGSGDQGMFGSERNILMNNSCYNFNKI